MDAEAAAAAQNLPFMQLMQLHQPFFASGAGRALSTEAHFETRERPVYELVIAKGGSRLKESTANETGMLRRSNGDGEGRSYSLEQLAFNRSGEQGALWWTRPVLQAGITLRSISPRMTGRDRPMPGRRFSPRLRTLVVP